MEIPKHLGIILDGNRRWAKENNLPTLRGHQRGAERAKEITKYCKKLGVKTLTFFCFSTENWKRSKFEVNYLMRLFDKYFLSENIKNYGEGIKLKVIGDRSKLPGYLKKSIEKTEKETEKNKEMILNLAISYGGRAELVSAIKNIVDKKIPTEKITEKIISDNLWTSDLDFIIRTGKEKRTSNFLIWQAAYSELYFSDKYWPAFTEKDLEKALEDYDQRKRRF